MTRPGRKEENVCYGGNQDGCNFSFIPWLTVKYFQANNILALACGCVLRHREKRRLKNISDPWYVDSIITQLNLPTKFQNLLLFLLLTTRV